MKWVEEHDLEDIIHEWDDLRRVGIDRRNGWAHIDTNENDQDRYTAAGVDLRYCRGKNAPRVSPMTSDIPEKKTLSIIAIHL